MNRRFKKKNEIMNRKAFTLVELMVTAFAAIIIIFGVGIVMVDSQKGWNKMYNRVHGDVATGAYVARIAFDTVIRKASINRSLLDVDDQFIEVYYYNDFSSAYPDRYAIFYRNGSLLMVDYGSYDWFERKTTLSTSVTLADHVKAVQFSVHGLSMRLVLTLDDGKEAMTLVTSALRHN